MSRVGRDLHDHAEPVWMLDVGVEMDASAALDRDGSIIVATRGGDSYGEDARVYRIRPRATSHSPDGWINPGWNWVSVPLEPTDPNAGSVFGWDNVVNRLYRWDPVMKNLELFPDDFTDLELGRGYTLRADADVPGSVLGHPTVTPFTIEIPEAGWQWIGHTLADPVRLKSLALRDGDTGELRTALEDVASLAPWVNWNWIYWDSSVQTARIMNPFGGADDTWLHPWYGYRVWANTEDVTIIFP